MIDQMVTNVATPKLAGLRMPLQAAPVDRTMSVGALGDASGVEADGIFDDIVGGITSVLPIAQAAAPLLAGLI
jgi:hypothetical protein